MTFAELFKEMFDSSKERAKTPISGSYILAFILWNWRPIILLLFEDAKISDKIVVINKEYCDIWAIAGPVGLAFLFTIGVPYITMLIDMVLVKPKSSRLQATYKEKIEDVGQKILLAAQEIKLQDTISRKKETQDLLDKIKLLEHKSTLDADTHKAIVDSYKDQIDELTHRLNQKTANRPAHDYYTNDDFSSLASRSGLTENEYRNISSLPEHADIPIGTPMTKNTEKFLLINDFIRKRGNLYYLTLKGLDFRLFVKNYMI